MKETIAITKNKLASYKLSMQEATEITQRFIDASSMAADDKDQCISAVNGAAVAKVEIVDERAQNFQTCNMLEHFLTDEIWDQICDPAVPVYSKVFILRIIPAPGPQTVA